MSSQHAFRDHLPSEVDVKSSDQLRKILAEIVEADKDTEVEIAVDKDSRGTVVLTHGIAQTFLDVLRLISSGKGFSLIPYGAELTTQEAADLLNVSRPYLIKLLESGEMDFSRVGRHRRIRASDLFKYKAERDQNRAAALKELADLDADLV